MKKLPNLTDKQCKWSENSLGKVGFYCRSHIWCTCCGHLFEVSKDDFKHRMKCPHCGNTLNVSKSAKKKVLDNRYYSIVTVFHGFQLLRTFLLKKFANRGRDTEYYHFEVSQEWIDADGRRTTCSRPLTFSNMYFFYGRYNLQKELTIKPNVCDDRYSVYTDYIYPVRKVLPKIKQHGYTSKVKGVFQGYLFLYLLKNPEVEILAKTHQYDLVRLFASTPESVRRYFNSIRIATKHGYIIKDATLWLDYVQMLEYFKKDLHSPHYLCPVDLHKAHDVLEKKKMKIERAKELEEKRKQAAVWEKKYKHLKERFFDIHIVSGDLTITPIHSVAEMEEEGQAMHHCVFSMGYYKKEDSLILSAKDNKGERVETIEVDLKHYSVVQSRGVCNTSTDKHNEIINLVVKNMDLIRNANSRKYGKDSISRQI